MSDVPTGFVAPDNTQIQQALADEVRPPEEYPTTAELPGGWLSTDGRAHRNAVVRELTGADEETLGRVWTKNDDLVAIRWANTLAQLGTVSIGGEPLERSDWDRMLIGDRDALLLAIRIATYGPDYETSIACPKCSKDSDVVFELDKDIKYRRLEDPELIYRKVELRHGRIAEVRLTNVADQAACYADSSWTPSEMNTVLLSHTVRSIDAEPVLGPQAMLKLGAADRKILTDYLAETGPGPLLGEVVAECPKCGQESPIALNVSLLFS